LLNDKLRLSTAARAVLVKAAIPIESEGTADAGGIAGNVPVD
jgi:hypothetical protein